MFEDIANNLIVPKARGMTTTLVVPRIGQIDHREPHDRGGFEAPHVDFVTDDLAGFLARVNAQLAGRG
jgi:putative hydrolase of the HAD superfamily